MLSTLSPTPSTKVRLQAVISSRQPLICHVVNKIKGQAKKWDDKSQFDTEKDKTNFRKYEEACDRVKNFYREQHGMFSVGILFPTFLPLHAEKQTVEYNVRVRADFKKNVRARMGTSYSSRTPYDVAHFFQVSGRPLRNSTHSWTTQTRMYASLWM